jgi:hypothetical protein
VAYPSPAGEPRLLPLVTLAYGIGLFFWLHLFPHPLTLILPLGA